MTPIVFTIYPFGKCPPSASFYPLEWPLKTVKFESVMSSIRLWSGLPSAQTALYKIAIYSLLRHTLVMNRRYNLYFIIAIQYMCNTPREKNYISHNWEFIATSRDPCLSTNLRIGFERMDALTPCGTVIHALRGGRSSSWA